MKDITHTISEKIEPIKKDFGIFFTPQWVIDFMVGLIDVSLLSGGNLSLLEPACGVCQFIQRIRKNRPELYRRFDTRVGVELNSEVVTYLRDSKLFPDVELVNADYLLWETDKKFDVIIGNPPYGIPSLSEHYTIRVDNTTKDRYKKLYETWYGKYNVYGAFIEKSIKLLKSGGQLIFIVPATFMILDEFKKLRKFLSINGTTELIYMGSDAFKPEADVTTVVLRFVKNGSGTVFLKDYDKNKIRDVKEEKNWDGSVITFRTDFTDRLERICSFKLEDIYKIHISPRTPEIRKNRYVLKQKLSEKMLPILNGRNLKIGQVLYEPYTGYWIEESKKTTLRKFFDRPHIVVGLGFRGNGRIGSAYDYRAYPWMGDVYHLLRKRMLTNLHFDLSEEEVVNYLNSELVSRYIKEVFRDITYHLNISKLKRIPLPKKSELEVAYRELL